MFETDGSSERPIRAALYARVSSEEQRDSQTIQTQIATAKKWLELQGLMEKSLEVDDFYLDDGVSGTIPLADRPAGNRLLEAASAGEFSIVLVYKIDRLGRDPRDILNSAHQLDRLGVAVKSLTEDFDMSSPSGRFMFNIFAAPAGFARDTQIERSVAGTNHWAREGVWLGGIVPYGYRVEGVKKQARLVVSNESIPSLGISEVDVVRLIYDMLAEEGQSCVKIAQHLNALGVSPAYVKDGRTIEREGPEGRRKRNTAGVWRPSRIRNLVVNSAYRGEHIYGKRSQKSRELISRTVPAIVDPDTWEKAQRALRSNQLFASGKSKRKYLLRGLVKCGTCGLNYHGTLVTRPNGKQAYYRCNGKDRFRGQLHHRCPNRTLRAEVCEEVIWADILGFLNDPGPLLEQLALSLQAQRVESQEVV